MNNQHHPYSTRILTFCYFVVSQKKKINNNAKNLHFATKYLEKYENFSECAVDWQVVLKNQTIPINLSFNENSSVFGYPDYICRFVRRSVMQTVFVS